jgi:hypothetical protein
MSLVTLDHPHLPPNQGKDTGFQPGHPRYGGRRKGSRNRIGGDLALHEPKTAAALLARVLPYFITVTEVPPVASRADIEAQIKEFGLPVGLIEHLQVAPAPLDDGEDPDPYGLEKVCHRGRGDTTAT